METERGRIEALPLGPIRPVKPSTGSEGEICHASGSRRLLRLSDRDKRSLNDVIAPRRRKVAVGRLWKFRNADSVGSPTTIFGFDNCVALATSAMKPTGVVGEIAWLRELSDVEWPKGRLYASAPSCPTAAPFSIPAIPRTKIRNHEPGAGNVSGHKAARPSAPAP